MLLLEQSEGPIADFNPVPAQVQYYSPTGGIEFIDWLDPENYLLQFDTFVVPASGPPSALEAVPVEYNFQDSMYLFPDGLDVANGAGIATVTSVPEASEWFMLLAGLAAVLLAGTARRSNFSS